MPTFSLQQKHAELDAKNARMMAQIAAETGDVPLVDTGRLLSRLGDELQLRGIPAIGRGVAGAVNPAAGGTVLGVRRWLGAVENYGCPKSR